MTFYSEMADVASELLTEFAQGTVVLRRTTTGSPDPDTPWIPGSSTTTDYTLEATVSGVSQRYVDGSTIFASDLEVMCAVPAVTPALSDAVLIDGAQAAILRIIAIPSAGTPAAYKIIVRR